MINTACSDSICRKQGRCARNGTQTGVRNVRKGRRRSEEQAACRKAGSDKRQTDPGRHIVVIGKLRLAHGRQKTCHRAE